MDGKCHAAIGFGVGLVTLYNFPEFDSYTVMSGTCLGSLLLDLDTKQSSLSKIFPPIAFIVDKLTKHRGFTHKILPFILIALYFYFNYIPFLMIAMGGLSHFGIDVFTRKTGIKIGSKGESVIYKGVWIFNFGLLFVLIFRNDPAAIQLWNLLLEQILKCLTMLLDYVRIKVG
jgi:hypothetical protein